MLRTVIFNRIAVEFQKSTIEEKNKELFKVLANVTATNSLPWKYFNLVSTDTNMKSETEDNLWPLSVPVTLKNFLTVANLPKRAPAIYIFNRADLFSVVARLAQTLL